MEWLIGDPPKLLMVVVTAVGIYVALILFTRMSGLRSFSKMSSFDFAMTVAIGSILASAVVAPTPSLVEGILALGSIFTLQWFVGRWRVHQETDGHPVDNEPLLLMDGPEMLERNMKSVRVTRADLVAKLRESNVLNRGQVRAVIMETTGDISVLHSADDSEPFEADLLLEEVRTDVH